MRVNTQPPAGWEIVWLGEVAEVDTGGTPSRSQPEFWGDPIPWMASGEVNQRRVSGTAERITKQGLKNSNAKAFPPGTVMLAMNGQGATRGKTCVLDIEATCNQSLAAISSGPRSNNRFLFQVLDSAYERLRGLTGDGRNGLNLGLIRTFRFTLPPLPEQRAISAVLDSIDEAIERTEAVIAATEHLRDSLLHELLTRGVPGWHSEWKEVPGIGTVPACWKVVRLEEVAGVERGKFAYRPRNDPQFYGGAIPFIQTGDVVQANGKINEHSQTLNEQGLSISRLFPAGTIVITIAANIGETAITDYAVAFPDSLVGITPTGIDTSFLEYFLRTQKVRLNQLAPESAQKNINLEDLRPLPTPIPSIKEQVAVAEILNSIQARMEREQGIAEATISSKLAASDALLTGRVRVSA